MKRLLVGVLAVILAMTPMYIEARDYYVAPNGSDTNPGTKAQPFATIQHGVNRLSAGDTLYLRAGSYHKEVIINNLNGTAANPITICNYQDEKVTLNGTVPITGSWTRHRGNIYKITVPQDVWQLFVDGRMQIIARWPNANTHPTDPVVRKTDSWEQEDGGWWSKTTWGHADMPGTNTNGTVENNPAYHNLAATGLSFEGGSAILALVGQGPGNCERKVNTHSAGSNTFTHDPLDDPRNKGYSHSKTFILEHLNALDRQEEWYYTPAENTVYLWADSGQNPTGRDIRGRTQTHAFDFTGCSYITIKGLKFFATNFRTDWNSNSTHLTVEDCVLLYPDASKRLLGTYPCNPDQSDYQTSLRGAHNKLINCEMKYTEFGAIQFSGDGTELHNNLFGHVCMLGIGYTGCILQVNKFTRNTFYICGARAGVKTNAGPQETRIQSYNYFNGLGFQQVQTDGTFLQCNSANAKGCNRGYNWFLNSARYGTRWDGNTGTNGLMHHNVGLVMKGTLMPKGDYHGNYNNSCMDSEVKNDIIIATDGLGNGNSITRNNLADKIAGHRTKSLSKCPIPGIHDHNWNGYVTGTDANLQLRDPDNLDFRPAPGSALIDAGSEIPGITDGYLGSAPDIGAYEYGDTNYWIPGRQVEKASRPISPDNATDVKFDADLMWLGGYKASSHDVYFGQRKVAVANANHTCDEYKGNQTNNIFDPGPLEPSSTYYWRVDTVKANGSVVKGDVWSFNTTQ